MMDGANSESAQEPFLAVGAVRAFVRDHPGVTPTEVLEHFFPKSQHGFTREEARLAIIDDLYYGVLRRDDGGLHLADLSGRTEASDGR